MAPRRVFPLAVTLENRGPSMDGALLVTLVSSGSMGESERRYLYPVSLPTGTNKKILAYPALNGYGYELTVQFLGPVRTRPA